MSTKCCQCGINLEEGESYPIGEKDYCADCHIDATDTPELGEEVEVDEQPVEDLVIEPETISGETEDA